MCDRFASNKRNEGPFEGAGRSLNGARLHRYCGTYLATNGFRLANTMVGNDHNNGRLAYGIPNFGPRRFSNRSILSSAGLVFV